MVPFRRHILLSSVLLLLFLSRLSCTAASIHSPPSPPACNRRCGSYDVPYPFGFSVGCQIQLNCSADGERQLGGYRVSNLTPDSIVVDVPFECHRSFAPAFRPLFGSNYAMTRRNFFFVWNCNGSDSCHISTDLLFTRLGRNSSSCGSGDDFRCFAPGGGSDGDRGALMNLHDIDARCYLFTSFRYDFNETSLVFGSAELAWWLDGAASCMCSPNANSTPVDTAVAGRKGCRCTCAPGFSGDGFREGSGCFKAAVSTFHKTRKNQMTIISASLAASVMVALVFVACLLERRHVLIIRSYSQSSRVAGFSDNEELELPLFDFKDISAATGNFCNDMMLGKGGFGFVYRGILADGKEIAVKRLSRTSSQGVQEFKNEVTLIAKLQHRNLVRLLGCCIERGERLLVYEYMPNRSLDVILFDKVKRISLAWERRHNIVVGIARGLLYLHQDSNFRIIHRDLKASNVLLDERMNPKISDFGVARMLGGDDAMSMTRKVVGTFGYIAPEYAMSGQFSVKSDVFSFGVLVLEVISGEKNKPFNHYVPTDNLLGRAWSLWNEGRSLELVDPSFAPNFDLSEVKKCIHVGLLCVQALPEDRPTMSTVVTMLVTDNLTLPVPKESNFIVTTPISNESPSPLDKQHDAYSVNYMSTTMVVGR